MLKGLVFDFEQIVSAKTFRIINFENHILTIKPEPTANLDDFVSEVFETLHRRDIEMFDISGINFVFEGVKSFATKEDDVYEIDIRYWVYADHQLRNKPITTTTSWHKISRAKKTARQERITEHVDNICNSLDFETSDIQAYIKEYINSDNEYFRATAKYAIRLGKYLQYLIIRHNKTIDKVLYNAIYDAATSDVSKQQRYLALFFLTHDWKYGMQLYKAIHL